MIEIGKKQKLIVAKTVDFGVYLAEDKNAGQEDRVLLPANSIATSVPAPIAIPMSALANAGASLMPSPTIATFFPEPCN